MNDRCEYNGTEKRQHCELVVSLKATFEEEQKSRDKWRTEIMEELKEISKFISEIKGPYRIGLWAFRLFIGGLITGFLGLIGWILKEKLHWG